MEAATGLKLHPNQAFEATVDAAPQGSRSVKEKRHPMSQGYTEKQGQYLAFIDNYATIHGQAPAEADIQRFFGTTPSTIHQMILKLEEKGFIRRVPRQARSIELLVDPETLPRLERRR